MLGFLFSLGNVNDIIAFPMPQTSNVSHQKPRNELISRMVFLSCLSAYISYKNTTADK